MKIHKSTRKYEKWLQAELDVIEADLAHKHEKMDESPFAFLRGTFYRWAQVWPKTCKANAKAPKVLSVGDLHAANFGTWQDTEGRTIWGVNDFDEVSPLPYTFDLTRLATSVLLASDSHELKISLKDACAAILDGYHQGLAAGGKPFILDEGHDWLRDAYLGDAASPEKYWKKITTLPNENGSIPPEVRTALEQTLPEPGLTYHIKHRRAGLGSLGRPRLTLVAKWDGQPFVREAKALLPSAATWARKKLKGTGILYKSALEQSVRVADPYVSLPGPWVIRRLSPDSRRIELDELGPERDEVRMMHAMGWETANIHLGTHDATKDILKDLKDRKKSWLKRAAEKMADTTLADWRDWKDHPTLEN